MKNTLKQLEKLKKAIENDSEPNKYSGLTFSFVIKKLEWLILNLKEEIDSQSAQTPDRSSSTVNVSCRDNQTVVVGKPIEFVYYRQTMKDKDAKENWVEGTLLYPPIVDHNNKLLHPVIKKDGMVLHYIFANDIRPLRMGL